MQHVVKVLVRFILVASICMCLGAVGDAANRYTTQRGDTLWKIAERYVDDDTMTTDEKMRALFDANPDAFINHNINLLRIGYTLRIPTQEEHRTTLAPLESEDQRTSTSVSEQPAPATDTHLVSPVEEDIFEDVDVNPTIVAEDVAKLQSELALTQEQASRQHADNEALRHRVAALEARVLKLGEIAATPTAADRASAAVTQDHPPSRTAVWWTIPTMMIVMSAAMVFGLAAIWYWQRRAESTTAATLTEQPLAERPETAATDPLALGLGDLDVDTKGPDGVDEVIATHADTGLGAETASDTPLAHLIIDLDDLELDASQAGEALPEWPNTASISSKAEPTSPPHAC
jgi:FimV-like protein